MILLLLLIHIILNSIYRSYCCHWLNLNALAISDDNNAHVYAYLYVVYTVGLVNIYVAIHVWALITSTGESFCQV